MNKWNRTVGSYDLQTIKAAVNQKDWQAFRVSLKGLSTSEKLDKLASWLDTHPDPHPNPSSGLWVAHVQVSNYINALKRSGHLTHTLFVT